MPQRQTRNERIDIEQPRSRRTDEVNELRFSTAERLIREGIWLIVEAFDL
jgi:hypothetical protein